MLKYFFSSIFVFICFFSTYSQKEQKDSISTSQRYGFRVGTDISKLARSLYDKNYKGIEIVGDYRITKKTYIAAEIGNENKTTIDDRLNFNTKGSYVKLGFDTNFYQNWLDMENMIHLGIRYGFSNFNQQLNSYKIYDTANYFSQIPEIPNNQKYNGLTAHFAEIVTGVKAKLFNNFYAGFSLRLNYLVSEKKPSNFDNLYIPGYNRTYNGKFGAGWNYTLSYLIPIYKKKEKTSFNTK